MNLQEKMQPLETLLKDEPERIREVYKMLLITALKRIIPRDEKLFRLFTSVVRLLLDKSATKNA